MNSRMASIEFTDITLETLPSVQKLLFERNETLYSYTAWKYGQASPDGFRGVVAIEGDIPIGCFGLMPKTLQLGYELISCGWFADWYVTPMMQGKGLGTQLLKQITQKGYQIFFGHPTPKSANAICLKNGWLKIPFQSSRRYVLSPYKYYGQRTHYLFKRIYLYLWYQLNTFRISHSEYIPSEITSTRQGYFIDHDLTWYSSQPINSSVTRTYNMWRGNKMEINFMDDLFPSGETRRRILSIENIESSPQDMFSFFAHTKAALINYMEIFTTDRLTDYVLRKAGTLQYKERPVVVYTGRDNIPDVNIQGLDREGWVYLAGRV